MRQFCQGLVTIPLGVKLGLFRGRHAPNLPPFLLGFFVGFLVGVMRQFFQSLATLLLRVKLGSFSWASCANFSKRSLATIPLGAHRNGGQFLANLGLFSGRHAPNFQSLATILLGAKLGSF